MLLYQRDVRFCIAANLVLPRRRAAAFFRGLGWHPCAIRKPGCGAPSEDSACCLCHRRATRSSWRTSMHSLLCRRMSSLCCSTRSTSARSRQRSQAEPFLASRHCGSGYSYSADLVEGGDADSRPFQILVFGYLQIMCIVSICVDIQASPSTLLVPAAQAPHISSRSIFLMQAANDQILCSIEQHKVAVEVAGHHVQAQVYGAAAARLQPEAILGRVHDVVVLEPHAATHRSQEQAVRYWLLWVGCQMLVSKQCLKAPAFPDSPGMVPSCSVCRPMRMPYLRDPGAESQIMHPRCRRYVTERIATTKISDRCELAGGTAHTNLGERVFSVVCCTYGLWRAPPSVGSTPGHAASATPPAPAARREWGLQHCVLEASTAEVGTRPEHRAPS